MSARCCDGAVDGANYRLGDPRTSAAGTVNALCKSDSNRRSRSQITLCASCFSRYRPRATGANSVFGECRMGTRGQPARRAGLQSDCCRPRSGPASSRRQRRSRDLVRRLSADVVWNDVVSRAVVVSLDTPPTPSVSCELHLVARGRQCHGLYRRTGKQRRGPRSRQPARVASGIRPVGRARSFSNDQRHRLVLSGFYEAPFDLQLSSIVTAASGRPYSVLAGFDFNRDGSPTDSARQPAVAPSDYSTSARRNSERLPGSVMLMSGASSGFRQAAVLSRRVD